MFFFKVEKIQQKCEKMKYLLKDTMRLLEKLKELKLNGSGMQEINFFENMEYRHPSI